MSLEDSRRKISEDSVEEVGLITCERNVVDQRARLLPHWAKCTGDLAPATSTWKRKRWKVKVQEDDVEDRETHGRKLGEEKGENKQSLRRMTHGWDDAHQHLSQRRVTDYYICARTRIVHRKSDV